MDDTRSSNLAAPKLESPKNSDSMQDKKLDKRKKREKKPNNFVRRFNHCFFRTRPFSKGKFNIKSSNKLSQSGSKEQEAGAAYIKSYNQTEFESPASMEPLQIPSMSLTTVASIEQTNLHPATKNEAQYEVNYTINAANVISSPKQLNREISVQEKKQFSSYIANSLESDILPESPFKELNEAKKIKTQNEITKHDSEETLVKEINSETENSNKSNKALPLGEESLSKDINIYKNSLTKNYAKLREEIAEELRSLNNTPTDQLSESELAQQDSDKTLEVLDKTLNNFSSQENITLSENDDLSNVTQFDKAKPESLKKVKSDTDVIIVGPPAFYAPARPSNVGFQLREKTVQETYAKRQISLSPVENPEFFIDVPETGIVGVDGSIMEMFNKVEVNKN